MKLLKFAQFCEIWNVQHDTSVEQRKIWVPRRNQTHDLLDTGAGALSTELQELIESKVILLSSYVTGILHTAKISTAEFIMSSDKWMKMVKFELGN